MGSGNPPDKYQIVVLTGDPTNDLAAINALADQGYRVEPVALPFNFVLMGNYKKGK